MAGATVPSPAANMAFAGFDTSGYPGDPKMKTWKQSSPYDFVAYYLKAPCHKNAGWMGHCAALVGMGWNVLPVYVGQQVAGVSPCTSSILTAAQGAIDGDDAGAKMAGEGFPVGTFVYLDVERCDIFSNPLRDYVTAWVSKISSSDFSPGVYCHKHNAPDVHAAVLAGLGGAPTVKPRFWIVGGVTAQFNIKTSKPADVGIAFAYIWQCPASVNRTFGGVTIGIDEDIALLADPAAPDGP